MKPPVEVLWCTRNPRRGKDGWSFPVDVRRLLIRETEGLSVLHLFGGKSDFGTRLDIDPSTKPDVIGDAWIPPFPRESFDVVILDPPYIRDFATMSNQKTRALFSAAAWIARKRVIWFHTVWIESPARCILEKAWLVRVGRHCTVRCLQFFTVPCPDRKLPPLRKFTRGPAIRYNRWLTENEVIPFEEDPRPKAVQDFVSAGM